MRGSASVGSGVVGDDQDRLFIIRAGQSVVAVPNLGNEGGAELQRRDRGFLANHLRRNLIARRRQLVVAALGFFANAVLRNAALPVAWLPGPYARFSSDW